MNITPIKAGILLFQKGVNMLKPKPYSELTIRDPFMFGKISSKPENRKIILDSLLQIDLHEKTGEIEKHIQEYKDSKYVRLDLLSKDEDNIIYNAEMQNKSQNKERQIELPKRSRYYQSILDTAHFNSGEPYIKLPETFIIFICTFDPFGLGLPIYTFDTKCNERETLAFDDATHKIFFNTTADLSDLPQNVRNMLEYINSGAVNDSATQIIEYEVTEARLKEEWKDEYMLTVTYRNEIYVEAHEEGLAEGRAEGLEEGQKEKLKDIVKRNIEKGRSIEEITEFTGESVDLIKEIAAQDN